jgi:hypothetical protein
MRSIGRRSCWLDELLGIYPRRTGRDFLKVSFSQPHSNERDGVTDTLPRSRNLSFTHHHLFEYPSGYLAPKICFCRFILSSLLSFLYPRSRARRDHAPPFPHSPSILLFSYWALLHWISEFLTAQTYYHTRHRCTPLYPPTFFLSMPKFLLRALL